MRNVLWLVLLSACSVREFSDSFDSQKALGPGVGQTSVVHLGDARLAPNGLPLTAESERYPPPFRVLEELTVVDPGQSVGVWVKLDQVELLLYLDRKDLGSWTSEPVDLPGLSLDANRPVEVLEDNGAEVLIEVGDRDIWATAWVPSVSVDQMWSVDIESADERTEPDRWLRGNTEILDAPSGTPFAWVDSFSTDEADQSEDVFWLPAIALTEPRDGFQELRVERDGFRVEGFVSVENVASYRNGGRGFSGTGMECGWVHVTGPRGPILVPAGTDLFLEPDGAWVGRTHAPIYQNVQPPDPASWRELPVSTPWGLAMVWVPPATDE